MNIVCGIDVSKAWLDVHFCGKDRRFGNDPEGWQALTRFARTAELFVMEASGSYHVGLAEWLFGAQFSVSVLNPAQSSHFAKALGLRSKNDVIDARTLALFASKVNVPRFTPPTEAQRELRSLSRHREELVRQLAGCRIRMADPGLQGFAKEQTQQQLDFLRTQLQACKARLKQLLAVEPLKSQYALLLTIPGVGEALAVALLAECRLDQFASAKQLAAFVGVFPKEFSSGSSVRLQPRLAKQGCARLRRALYMPALAAIRRPGAFRTFYDRLLARGKSKMSAIGAVMHKLLRVAYGVLSGSVPYDGRLLTSAR